MYVLNVYSIPQFTIQLWYLSIQNGKVNDTDRDDDENNNDHELLPIVIVALVSTSISIVFGLLKIVKQLLYEDICLNPQNTYEYQTSIKCNFLIKCDGKVSMSKSFSFCHNKIQNAIKQTLNTCEYNGSWTNRSDVFYSVECYHIETQHYLRKLFVYFDTDLYGVQSETHSKIANKMQKSIIKMFDSSCDTGKDFSQVKSFFFLFFFNNNNY